MVRVTIALAGGLLLCGQALAADLPMPAPPPRAPAAYVPIVPVFTWSGVYIGANGGYSFGTTQPPGGTNFSTNGIVAGGTIGANVQTGALVFGAEGDFDWDNIKGSPAVTACPTGATSCQVSSNWLGTARGRIGVAFDRLLVYGTGGAAFENLKFAAPPLATTVTSTPFGWTGGGGVEFAFTPNWSVKAEYLYVKFSNVNVTAGGVSGTFNLIENIVRGGVNFRF